VDEDCIVDEERWVEMLQRGVEMRYLETESGVEGESSVEAESSIAVDSGEETESIVETAETSVAQNTFR
jgi:hypothetical protein